MRLSFERFEITTVFNKQEICISWANVLKETSQQCVDTRSFLIISVEADFTVFIGVDVTHISMRLTEQISSMKRLMGLNESIIAFHGTNKTFDGFDPKYIGTSNDPGDYGAGFYFDSDKSSAAAYGHNAQGTILTAELLLKNPYLINFKEYVNYKRENRYNTNNPELTKYMDTLIDGGAPTSIKTLYDNFLSTSRGLGANKVTEYLKNKGYDGVIVDYGNSKEIVVFNPTDIRVTGKEKISDYYNELKLKA